MEKRSAKRFLMIFIICGLCWVFRFDTQAAEFDYSPISELPQGADAGDYIKPGEELAIPKLLYIPRGCMSGKYQEGAFRLAFADMEYSNSEMNYFARVKRSDPGIYVNWSVVTNHMGCNALTDDWDDFVREVKHQMADGCDLCGYTFFFDTGETVDKIAVFYRLDTQNMAEIIGICDREEDKGVADAARYMAASFEDLGGTVDRAGGSQCACCSLGDG